MIKQESKNVHQECGWLSVWELIRVPTGRVESIVIEKQILLVLDGREKVFLL